MRQFPRSSKEGGMKPPLNPSVDGGRPNVPSPPDTSRRDRVRVIRDKGYFRGRVNSPLPPSLAKRGAEKDHGPDIESAGGVFRSLKAEL